MYNGSTILLCVTIFVIHKQCFIRAHCSIVTVVDTVFAWPLLSGLLRDTILHWADFWHWADSLSGPGLRLPAMPGLAFWPIFGGRSPQCCKNTLKYVLPALWGTGSRNLSHFGFFELSSIARNLAVCPEHLGRAFLLGVLYPKRDALACQCLSWVSAPQLPQLTAWFPTMQ
jgi:hypothetical protein